MGQSLRIESDGALVVFPVAEGELSAHMGWDSMGNDAPHDGNGIGNTAGDHTDHRMFLDVDRAPGGLAGRSGGGLSVEELLQIRASLRKG